MIFDIHTLTIFIHVILFVYWLGPDWGVYVTSHYVANPNLPIDERRRFLMAALRIDLVPRSALILLLPVGLQLANGLGISAVKGPVLVASWIFALAWLVLSWAVYLNQTTPKGQTLKRIDNGIRWVLSAVLIAAGVFALITGQLFETGWLAAKVIGFGVILFLGLLLRRVMGAWAVGFQALVEKGSTPETEAYFGDALRRAKPIVYCFWGSSAVMGFLGVIKPGF